MIKVNTDYMHFKGGKYKVILIARSSESLEESVIYQQLYDSKEFPMGTFWSRLVEEFDSEVKVKGKVVKRFKEIKIK